MTNELDVLEYREYYSSIRNRMAEKKVYLTKANCEVVGQPVGFLEQPECLLNNNGYEEPLYLRENIEIIFKEEYNNRFSELGIEEKVVLKNKLSLPSESPVRYLMISGRLSKVFSLEQIGNANSLNIYNELNLPDSFWKQYQVEKRFPELSLQPSGFYFGRVQQELEPVFDVSGVLHEKQLMTYTDKELYRIRSFLIGKLYDFDSLPQSWRIKIEPDHMEELGYYGGMPVVKLLPSALTDSPLSTILDKTEIEYDDILCSLWDVETLRIILNANNRKITALIPKGMTEDELAVFSTHQLGGLKERFHVYLACNKF